MSIIDRFLGVIAPFDCISCGQEGDLMCVGCRSSLPHNPSRCYRCRRLTEGYRTCSSCRSSSYLSKVYVATEYTGPAKELIWQLKFQSAVSAARLAASRMAYILPKQRDTLLVPVPTATKRVRQRGYDQAILLAREVSKLTGQKYICCLARSGQAKQIGSSRRQRIKHMINSLRLTKPDIIDGKNIILVDDIVTTGATLEAAAKVLRGAGAKRVEAIVFAQP